MTALGDSPNTPKPLPLARDPEPPGRSPGEDAHGRGLGFELPSASTLSIPRAFAFCALFVNVCGIAFLLAWLPKRHAQQALVTATKTFETTAPRVQIVMPKVKSSERALSLPCSIQPLEETIVYPRSSGYVNRWRVDIGDKVDAGTVLVDIDEPEIEQQLGQAKAQLAQSQAGIILAQANRDFSKTTLSRYTNLTREGVASQQDLDQKQSQLLVDEANVKAANAAVDAQQANVRRFAQMMSWGLITAPFAGTVNARMIERGALVSTTTPLFKISATDPMRVLVQVPQDVAPSVRNDVPAHVTVREYPGRTFDGKVARSAGSLDPLTRTMNTEIRVPNPHGELLGGMYAVVALTLPSPHRVFELPATAVMADAKGLRVAVVEPDGHLKLVPVVVERDTGSTLEIANGVTESDRVVRLGTTDLVDGRNVTIVP